MYKTQGWISNLSMVRWCTAVQLGITRRCRLSLLTYSALVIRVQKGGLSGGVSANEYRCAHHVTWSPNKLLTYAVQCTSDFSFDKLGVRFVEKGPDVLFFSDLGGDQ
jgi:hypothetical protein